MSTTTLIPLPPLSLPDGRELVRPEGLPKLRLPQSATFWKRLLGFVGPGFLISVGYMDPGNWATDIAGGSRFGYSLLFVVMAANLIAMLLQSLSLKLGIATERDLAQLCREQYGPVASVLLWIGAEIAIAACDLAEVIGSAIALQLLFHIPLFIGALITGADVMMLLALERLGMRKMESLVIVLIGTIVGLFAIQVILSRPEYGSVLWNLVVPSKSILGDHEMLFISIGMLGATVMPHNLYLHSSLAQSRNYARTSEGKREAIKMGYIDSHSALFLAMLVNAAILVVAAAVFFRTGHFEVAAIQDAYKLLSPLVGTAGASTLFAVALLASGQNSSITGTMAGQVVMEGFVNMKIAPWLRRMITRGMAIVPALIVIAFFGEQATEKLLIMSQVVLSIQLSFAVVPLVIFTSKRSLMGEFVNSRVTKVAAWTVAVLIAVLNGWFLLQMV